MNARNKALPHTYLKPGLLFLITVSLVTVFMVSNGRAVNAADPKKEMKEAAEAIAEYSVEQKDEAVEKAGKMMETLDKRIEVVEERVAENWDGFKQSTKEQYRKTFKVLQKKRNELSEYYGSLKHSSRGAWHEVRDGFAKSYNQLVLSWQEAETDIQQEKQQEKKKE